MAICHFCEQEMMSADGCTDAPIVIRDRPYQPVRYGRERGWRRSRDLGRCGDCGILPGQVHHHGCDIEQCPACGRQSISCGCQWAGDDDDDGEDCDDDWDDDDWDDDDWDDDMETLQPASIVIELDLRPTPDPMKRLSSGAAAARHRSSPP